MTSRPAKTKTATFQARFLGRVGACHGVPVLVNDEELRQWPSAAVKAMKSQKLLAKARPAASAICPGCERECVMPVHTLPGTRPSFIVCDKRNDVNRIVVSAKRLTQWQCNVEMLCGVVMSSIGIRSRSRKKDDTGRLEIGVYSGEKRSQMLLLEAKGKLSLIAGNTMVPVAELIQFHDGKYWLDREMIRRLVDACTMADERYTPIIARRETRKLATQGMYASWRKEYRALRRKRPDMSDVWHSLQIAKMKIACGRDAETIRKQMKR